MKRNDVHTFSGNAHVRSKTLLEFYHGIIYIANVGCHIIYNLR